MKIAITGHTRGIGKAIAEALEARGHEIHGMSASNGYSLPEDFERIVEETIPCDILINNAYHHNSQVQLLYRVFRAWEGEDKRIICIGSRAAEHQTPNKVSQYAAQKVALDAACNQLTNRRDQRPLVSIVSPGYVDTDAVRKVSHSPKLTPKHIADTVMWILDQPAMVHIHKVCLQHRQFG
jgi:NADP-dependent 3-hydroxy acid dehydrogenase YdfG